MALVAFAPAVLADSGSAELRYTVLATASLDGAPATDATAQAAFVQALVRSGATVIDLPQAQRSANDLNVSELARGKVPAALTALDADVLIALEVRAVKDDGSSLLTEVDRKLVRYQATVNASLIAVDSAQVLDTFVLSAKAIETNAAYSSRAAFKRAGELLAEQVLANKSRPSQRVELWVEKLPPAVMERLRGALSAISGVRSVKTIYASPALTKISLLLEASAPLGPELAAAIDGAADAGLLITGHSDRVFHAQYAAKIKVLFTQFAGNRSKIGARLGDLIGRPLLDSSKLAEAREGSIALGKSVTEREAALEKLGLLDTRALFLTGTYVDRGKEIDIEAELRSTRRGFELYVRDGETCATSALMKCTAELSKRLAEKLPKALLEKRTTGEPTEGLSLEIVQLSFEKDLFPARAGAYEQNGIGRVVIHNRSSSRALRGNVRVTIGELDAAMRDAPEIAPGERAEVVLPFVMSRVPEARAAAPIAIEVSYDVAGRRERLAKRESIQVLPIYALSWDEPSSAAAFVTARANDVRALASAALAALPEAKRSDPLARAAALFRVLHGLTYQKDGHVMRRGGEADDVQLPVETLSRKIGDCDDLSVLYAALAEAAGTRTILVLTPGHVFAALDTELPAQGAKKISLEEDRVILHDGRVFIPVETTMTGRSFAESWDTARATIARLRQEKVALEIVDVRSAWELYPALTLADAKSSSFRPVFTGIEAEVNALFAARERAVDRVVAEHADLAKLDARALSEHAALLVLHGRTEEAMKVLEHAVIRFPKVVALTNNLGNAHLARGSAEDAQTFYDRALRAAKAPESAVQIRLNLALAARVLGGTPAFHEKLGEAMDAATTEASRKIIDDFVRGFGNSSALTGSNAKKQRSKGQVEDSRAAISDLVFWLRPEMR